MQFEGRSLLLFLLAVAIAYLPRPTTAQSSAGSNAPHPAQLIFKVSNNLSTATSPSSAATTLPPTEFRVLYPANAEEFHTPVFPNRIRFSQSQFPVTRALPGQVAEARADPESFQEVDRYAANRAGGASVNLLTRPGVFIPAPELVTRPLVFTQSVVNQSSPLWNDTVMDNTTSHDYANVHARIALDASGDKVVGLGLPSGPSSFSNASTVGPITVGALIGIIAGILTALVLAVFIGLICYRRRHPTWNTAETDLRVLAAHYGSYWDDKTLPNYQFNDRMIWPGETHDEMIALDNDAFLKSLEDLGRVNSRPSSKTNWNTEEDQRQSTKV